MKPLLSILELTLEAVVKANQTLEAVFLALLMPPLIIRQHEQGLSRSSLSISRVTAKVTGQ